MEQFYGGRTERFRRHLPRLYSILERTTILSDQEKKQVKEAMDMEYGHDWFIETLPEVIDLVAQGEQKGRLEEAQKTVVEVIEARFPVLQSLAEEHVHNHPDIGHLRQLRTKILKAADEAEAKYWLSIDEARQND